MCSNFSHKFFNTERSKMTIPYLYTCFLMAVIYEEHLESKERFAIQRYLLIIGKKKNMQVL